MTGRPAARTLLLVDPNPLTRRLMELMFAAENVRILASADGQMAVDMMRAEHPDVVFADQAAPVKDGYEVAALARADASLESIPVVLLAGAFEPVDDERAAASGCAGVLVRPFDPQETVARFRALADRARAAEDARTPEPSTPVMVAAVAPSAPDTVTLADTTAQATPEPAATAVQTREQALQAVFEAASSHTSSRFGSATDSTGEDGSREPRSEATELAAYLARLETALGGLRTASRPVPPSSSTPQDDLPTLDRLLDDAAAVPALAPYGIQPSEPQLSEPQPSEDQPSEDHPLDEPATETQMLETLSQPSWQQPVWQDPAAPAAGSGMESSPPAPAPVDQPPAGEWAGPVSSDADRVETDPMVQEMARRVVAQVDDGALRRAIADMVRQVAEQVVREELQRQRAGPPPPP